MKSSILLIDDSKKMRRQIADMLKDAGLFNFILEAGDGIEGFKTALEREPDVILCDIEMPGMNGFKFLRMQRMQEKLQDIPVILLSGREDADAKIKGLDLGAADYVTKPFHPGELLARIKLQLKIKSLQDRLQATNEMLLELSHTDPLTGLHNRRKMMETLDREMQRSRRTGDPLCLVMIDLDDFKTINDTYGHLKGDQILEGLGKTFRRHLRPYDSVARFGGDEFTLVLPSTDLSEAAVIAERLRQEVAHRVDAEHEGLKVTISLGVAHFSEEEMKSPDDLIRKADYDLYTAKKTGRDRVIAA